MEPLFQTKCVNSAQPWASVFDGRTNNNFHTVIAPPAWVSENHGQNLAPSVQQTSGTFFSSPEPATENPDQNAFLHQNNVNHQTSPKFSISSPDVGMGNLPGPSSSEGSQARQTLPNEDLSATKLSGQGDFGDQNRGSDQPELSDNDEKKKEEGDWQVTYTSGQCPVFPRLRHFRCWERALLQSARSSRSSIYHSIGLLQYFPQAWIPGTNRTIRPRLPTPVCQRLLQRNLRRQRLMRR